MAEHKTDVAAIARQQLSGIPVREAPPPPAKPADVYLPNDPNANEFRRAFAANEEQQRKALPRTGSFGG